MTRWWIPVVAPSVAGTGCTPAGDPPEPPRPGEQPEPCEVLSVPCVTAGVKGHPAEPGRHRANVAARDPAVALADHGCAHLAQSGRGDRGGRAPSLDLPGAAARGRRDPPGRSDRRGRGEGVGDPRRRPGGPRGPEPAVAGGPIRPLGHHRHGPHHRTARATPRRPRPAGARAAADPDRRRGMPPEAPGPVARQRRRRDHLSGPGREVFEHLPRPNGIVRELHRQMERAGRPGWVGATSAPEELGRLDELRRRGAISQAEFDARRERLGRPW